MIGPNLSEKEKQILLEVHWMALDEICERDRAFLWTAGLAGYWNFSMNLHLGAMI